MPDKQISRVARQAHDVFKQHGCRWNTYFYKVVLAGNDDVIKQVVTYMENNAMTETLDWLFQRNAFEEIRHQKQKTSQRVFMMRIIMFILFTIINIVLTPCFYALHILSTSLLNRKQRRISASIKLPLTYAAFSQRKEMIAFFLSQGVETDQVDHRGNNVFHYIADLSAVASDKAIQIFHNMVTQMEGEMDDVDRMLIRDRNSAGLTAVEYATKFGSPALLSQILKQPNLMHRTPFFASTDHINISDDDGTLENVESNEKEILLESNANTEKCEPTDAYRAASDADTRVELVDVTMYEAGSIADQSTLLNILSDRDVASMSRSDLEIFDDDEFIGKWLVLKCRQMFAGVAFVHVVDVFVTCLTVVVFSSVITGKDSTTFHEWRIREESKVQMLELRAWADNTSEIFEPSVFHHRVRTTTLTVQRNVLKAIMEETPSKLQHLLNVTSLEQMMLTLDAKTLSGDYNNISVEDYAAYAKAMDVLYDRANGMPDFRNNMQAWRLARLFPRFVQEFAVRVYEKRDLFQDANGFLYNPRDAIALFEQFTLVDDGGDIVKPLGDFSLGPFAHILCPSLHELKQSDFRYPSGLPLEEFQTVPGIGACSYYVLVNVFEINQTCVHADASSILRGWANRAVNAEFVQLSKQFMMVYIYFYIVLDILERCVFLSNSVVYQTTLKDMLLASLGQKVPGSYMRKQLNVLSLIAVLLKMHLTTFATSNLYEFRTATEYYSYIKLVNMACIVAIVVRFVMHIHALRLLPGIGHFVITTFMMGTNLLHFSAVFGIVIIIFSSLFHILIDNPDCPLEKLPGFETIHDSLFSTFQLTFGHGEFDAYVGSTPVKLTYVLYVIIVGLLLLNLIIAIMSTTATEIMAEPWRDVLWKIEWLDEATSVEFSFSVVTLPLRKFLHQRLGYIFNKKAGYVVKKRGRNNIYIECFQCPALRD